VLKAQAYDRFLVSLFAPAACREALWALHAFNLELGRVRHAVREPLLGRIRLQWWREAIDDVYRGAPASEPVSQAIAASLPAHRLSRELLQAIIDSHEADLCDPPAPERTDILLFRLRANTVPLVNVALDILGVDHPATVQAAHSIGLAAAVAERIRVAPVQVQQNRPAPLPALPQHPQADTTAELAGHAAGYLQQARSAEVIFNRHSRAILLPATLTADYLARLSKSSYRVEDVPDARRQPAVMIKLALHAALRRY
jgi:phytoene synthase